MAWPQIKFRALPLLYLLPESGGDSNSVSLCVKKMTLSDALSLLRDILTFVAALLAVIGVRAWHRDFLGKREIELAEETLRLFYQARDSIRRMRSPFAVGAESSEVTQEPGESDERFHWRRTVAPLWKRYSNDMSLFAELESTKYTFMARFGVDTRESFDAMRMLTNKLFTAANMLVLTANINDDFDIADPNDNARMAKSRAQRRNWEEQIWEVGEGDLVNEELNRIIENMELRCRTVLDRRSWFQRSWEQLKGWWVAPVGKTGS